MTNDSDDYHEALFVVNNKIGIYDTESYEQIVDITEELKAVIDSSTEIYLDGCRTAESETTVVKYVLDTNTDVSREMSKVVDCIVSGNRGLAAGHFTYFGAWWAISWKISYIKGIAE